MTFTTFVITVSCSILSGGSLLAMKWFYEFIKETQKFREHIIITTTKYVGELADLKHEVLSGNEQMSKMFAEEIHPLSARVKRLKRGLNIVESKNSITLTSFEDLEEN